MTFCPLCREWLRRHGKAARWAAFFIFLSVFFFWLGTVSKPVVEAGFCKVYY